MNYAKLIAVTKPVDELNCDVKEFVAYVARVSNPSNQYNKLTAKKLLKYLLENNHVSPFEMVNLVMEINTTRDIARQVLRHRSFSFQEFSQRYANVSENMGFTHRQTRLQDTKNRQNSIDTDNEALILGWDEHQKHVLSAAKEAYEWAINNGIAKEQARVVLPEGLTMSRLYMNGTLRSWIHYCQLRMKNGTQKEHMILAESCWKEVTKVFTELEDILI